MPSNSQTLRLRRPETSKPAQSKQPARHTGLLQDQLRRAAKRPWSPSFSLAVRILLIVRFMGAMYSNIDDCDEVFNFWEPLHFFHRGYGFQTWEVSPKYAIRSWAYILLHALPVKIASTVFGNEKRAAFFAVRISLAVASTLCEAKFYRAVFETINERVGRYLFFILLFSAGMWNASAALLPSSFTMYTTMLAFSYAVAPGSTRNRERTFYATIFFAAGGIIGWPFALALSIPFILEELFVAGADQVTPENRISWITARWKRLFTAGAVAALLFIPVIAIDTLSYGRLAIVPWNIVSYNIFGGANHGPELYGTEPWPFYFLNLLLNFNVITPLAILSLPALGVTYMVDRKRLGIVSTSTNQSSPFTLLSIRLLPFYVWLGVLTIQPHKEERFMFPAYPLLAFNAAVALYLVRGWMEVAFISATKSPYKAAQSTIFKTFTLSVLLTSGLISLSRIFALWTNYHAPLSIVHHFEYAEIPRLLNASGLLPESLNTTNADEGLRIDLTTVRELNLTLCIGKEWYRFPGHFLIPDGIRVDFIKSEFDGMLPRHFHEEGLGWPRRGTREVPDDLNDSNKEDRRHYVSLDTCDYLIDLDFPLHPVPSPHEPRYAVNAGMWDRVVCRPFLDGRHSSLLTRTLWLPAEVWQNQNQFGDYCLLRNREKVSRKERESVATNVKKA